MTKPKKSPRPVAPARRVPGSAPQVIGKGEITGYKIPSGPFGTASEVNDALRSIGVANPQFGQKDLDIANNVYKSLAKTASDGLPIPKNVRFIESTDKFAGKTKPLAAYSSKDDALVINPAKKIWNDAKAHAQQQREAGWWSSGDELHIVTHEIGHQAHFKGIGEEGYQISNRLPVLPLGPSGKPLPRGSVSREIFSWQEQTAEQVSRYAMTSQGEFVAEVFAGIRSGNVYSDDIMAVYRAYGGPELP